MQVLLTKALLYGRRRCRNQWFFFVLLIPVNWKYQLSWYLSVNERAMIGRVSGPFLLYDPQNLMFVWLANISLEDILI